MATDALVALSSNPITVIDQKTLTIRGTLLVGPFGSDYPAGGIPVDFQQDAVNIEDDPVEVRCWSLGASGYKYVYDYVAGTLRIQVSDDAAPDADITGSVPQAITGDVYSVGADEIGYAATYYRA